MIVVAYVPNYIYIYIFGSLKRDLELLFPVQPLIAELFVYGSHGYHCRTLAHAHTCSLIQVLATGYGKSLLYQFPAVMTRKVAICVSPLISLMQDQVLGLTERGISSV